MSRAHFRFSPESRRGVLSFSSFVASEHQTRIRRIGLINADQAVSIRPINLIRIRFSGQAGRPTA